MKFAHSKLSNMYLNSSKQILFYGTPEFAAHSLRLLIEKEFNIIGVVTAPDKPAGRGLQIQLSDVKKAAIELGIPTFQPTNLKSEEFAQVLNQLQPDMQIVIAFRMLPEKVWAFPPMGTFNLHASLLPQYRGAAPINHAIINGESTTGVTTFLIEKEIDTGKILMQKEVAISAQDTAKTLHDKLMIEGAELVAKTAEGLIQNILIPQAQEVVFAELKHAPKLFPDNCKIDWNRDASDVYNFIRGLSPYPAAKTEFMGRNYKIFFANIADFSSPLIPGEWHVQGQELLIGTASLPLSVTEIQQEGKKRLAVEEFLKGFRLK
jgi:methionyl-tRNA formyltransferase